MEGEGDAQVGGVSHRERRCGSVEKKERASTIKSYRWGGSRKEQENNDPENSRNRWGRRPILKV